MEKSKLDSKKDKEFADEYLSSLIDLQYNSKPLIDMLTILAEENIEHGQVIVDAVEQHISKVAVDFKLPVLYLIDSIVKNVGREYAQLFSHSIVNIFCGVFEKVNEKVRHKMFSLRQTWNDVFPQAKLYTLDVKVNCMDPGWPITAKTPSIHVNPNFFKSKAQPETDMQAQLREKERELLELKKRKLELELAATKKHIEEQEKQLNLQTASVTPLTLAKPDYARPSVPSLAVPIIQQPVQRIRVAPVNPALIMRMRDPRLAMKMQQAAAAAAEKEAAIVTALKQETNATMALGGPHSHDGPRFVPTTSVNSIAAAVEQIPTVSQLNKNMKEMIQKETAELASRSSKNTSTSSKRSPTKSLSRSSRTSKSSTTVSSSRTSTTSTHRNRRDSREIREKTRQRTDNKATESRSAERLKKRTSTSSMESILAPPKKPNVVPMAEDLSESDEPSEPPAIKFTKVSTRNRNYMARNRDAASQSPPAAPSFFTEDVDLRLKLEVPPAPEITAEDIKPVIDVPAVAIKTDDVKPEPAPIPDPLPEPVTPEQTTFVAPNGDIDLRVPSAAAMDIVEETKPIVVSESIEVSSVQIVDIKRRASADEKAPCKDEPINKKMKNEDIDLLFGSEDVDLRKELPLGMIAPPPPMITSAPIVKVEDPDGWATIKAESPVPQRSSLDAVRAKLAEATRVKEVQQKAVMSRPDVSTGDRRSRLLQELQAETAGDNSQDAKYNMIVTQAQQQFDNDAISLEQYNGLIKQVMQVQTHQKRESLKRKSTAARVAASPSPALVTAEPDENGICSTGDTDLRVIKRARPVDSDAMAEMATSTVDVKPTRPRDRPRKTKWSQPTWEQTQHQAQLHASAQVQPQLFPMSAVQQPFPPIVSGVLPWPQHQTMPFNQQQLLWQQQQQQQQQMAAAAATAFQQQQFGLAKAATCRTITIDGVPREIRFYEEVAIAFMQENGGDPREIGFQAGERQVTVDQKDAIVLAFNDTYKPFVISGETHQIRFGSPIRELYINGQWYECFFGDPPVVIPLAGQQRVFQIAGPSPQVRIGSRRQDLVLGKIDFYIDGIHRVPLFLDGLQQWFELDGQRHSVQFADYLLTVILDGESMSVEYGGMPKRWRIPNGRDRSIRFSVLPIGVIAGRVFIRNMKRTDLHRNLSSPVPQSVAAEVAAPAVPIAVPTINIDDLFQKLMASGILGGSSKAAAAVEDGKDDDDVSESNETSPKNKERRERPTPIDLSKAETVKKRQPAYIHRLFSGMQCSSCGVRFPPEQTIKYSQHLDWHFRQNRRDRDSARRAHSRCWYYDVTDWIQYEEIEDLDEREKNWFETQQLEMQENGGGNGPGGNNDAPTGQPSVGSFDAAQPSCVAGPEDVDRTCDMCHDQFETFYNEETEDWHLRNAVRVDECTYHPICHEDYKKSLLPPEVKPEEDSAAEDIIPKTDGDDVEKIVLDDDDDDDEQNVDDDVIVVPAEEPVITEINDEDEPILGSTDIVSNPLDAKIPTEDVAVEPVASSSPQLPSDDPSVKDQPKEQLEPNYEPIGNESDIQILVPQISVLDLDEFEEKPVVAATDDVSAAPVVPVKIKQEPKDDDEEDDGFEDVGTFEVASIIDDDSQPDTEEQTTPAVVPILQTPQSMITSLDGNVQLHDTQPALATNRIKINITKNVTKLSSAAELLDKANEAADAAAAAASAAAVEPELEITFEYKPSMREIAFKKLPPVRNGVDTSGLCSIM